MLVDDCNPNALDGRSRWSSASSAPRTFTQNPRFEFSVIITPVGVSRSPAEILKRFQAAVYSIMTPRLTLEYHRSSSPSPPILSSTSEWKPCQKLNSFPAHNRFTAQFDRLAPRVFRTEFCCWRLWPKGPRRFRDCSTATTLKSWGRPWPT